MNYEPENKCTMKREIITTDEYGNVNMPTDTTNIWMTEAEIVELFDVIAPTIRAAINAVYKSGVLREDDTKRTIRQENGNRLEIHNLETVTALAFRLNTYSAAVFRKWLIRRATVPAQATPPIIIQYKDGLLN